MSYVFNAEIAKLEIIDWIRKWFDENGPDCNAVVGISGGKDSSVVAALCVEALGVDRVYGVLMPNGTQADIEDSYRVTDSLHIRNTTIDISPIVNALRGQVLSWMNLSEQAEINLVPRIRMATLYAVSQSMNGRVANTCNYSEDFVGWATRWGDNVGDFSPLSNLTTDEVIQIGLLCKDLPEDLVMKVPSDGLCGKTDEDALGFSYADLNSFIHYGPDSVDEGTRNKITALWSKNSFKLCSLPSYIAFPERKIFMRCASQFAKHYNFEQSLWEMTFA